MFSQRQWILLSQPQGTCIAKGEAVDAFQSSGWKSGPRASSNCTVVYWLEYSLRPIRNVATDKKASQAYGLVVPKNTVTGILFVFHGATAHSRPRPLHYRGFTITLRHTTLGRTPLDEWSTSHRDLYLTHNTHNRHTSQHPAGFEPAIPAGER